MCYQGYTFKINNTVRFIRLITMNLIMMLNFCEIANKRPDFKTRYETDINLINCHVTRTRLSKFDQEKHIAVLARSARLSLKLC